MAEGKQRQSAVSEVVYIVDDDLSIRESLSDLLRAASIEAMAFESAAAFMEQADLARPGCILLDVRLPGLNGLDFQARLEAMGSRLPIVFMTGFGDIPMSVKAMKAGAVDFLTKPFGEEEILGAVGTALEKDGVQRRHAAANDAVSSLFLTLTPREREVMQCVVKGLMNKQIAYELGISEVTVKLHRGNVVRKMKARSLAELVKFSEILPGEPQSR
jgi:FixJ family two-component response regulator